VTSRINVIKCDQYTNSLHDKLIHGTVRCCKQLRNKTINKCIVYICVNVMKNKMFDNKFDRFFVIKYPEYTIKLFNLRNAIYTIILNLFRNTKNPNLRKKIIMQI